MANKIASVNDVKQYLYDPSAIGLQKCVTPALLNERVNQGYFYSINGDYADNRLVPLNNITFRAYGVYLSVVIQDYSTISTGQYTTINVTGAGINITKQINSNSDSGVVIKKHLCGNGDTVQIKIKNSASFSSTSSQGVRIGVFGHENTIEGVGIQPVINDRGSERFLASGTSIEGIAGRYAYCNIATNNSIDSTITFTSSANKKLTVIVTKE